MKTWWFAVALLSAFQPEPMGEALAADAPIVIVFPVIEPPAPVPAPPSAVTKLPADVFYVISSDVAFLAVASPSGLLGLTHETGPLRIRGKFIEDPSKVQTKTYSQKYLVIVEARASGMAELLVLPTGATSEQQYIRRMLDSSVGPDPPKPPDPPTPPSDPFAAAIQAAYLADSGADKAKQVAYLAYIYRTASTGSIFTSEVKNTADVLAKLKAVVGGPTGLPVDALKGVRRAVADELNKTLSKPTTLDDAKKAELQADFLRVAKALEAVK